MNWLEKLLEKVRKLGSIGYFDGVEMDWVTIRTYDIDSKHRNYIVYFFGYTYDEKDIRFKVYFNIDDLSLVAYGFER